MLFHFLIFLHKKDFKKSRIFSGVMFLCIMIFQYINSELVLLCLLVQSYHILNICSFLLLLLWSVCVCWVYLLCFLFLFSVFIILLFILSFYRSAFWNVGNSIASFIPSWNPTIIYFMCTRQVPATYLITKYLYHNSSYSSLKFKFKIYRFRQPTCNRDYKFSTFESNTYDLILLIYHF